MNARDALIDYAASTRTVTADGLAPYIDRIEKEAKTIGDHRDLRHLELLETSLIDYINHPTTPDMVSHMLTGLMALATARANDEFPQP